MIRIPLTDGTGRWFDAEKAEEWDEDSNWDGNNHISVATGSQWSHETLHRTVGGRWIVHSFSSWSGSVDQFEEISDEAAAAWLVLNGHESHEACAEEFAALEIK
jgi:hypothetical protein